MNKVIYEGVVIYQVYPRSFFDSNNDGIGDLPGIIEKLPYIKNLGADYVWISPFFTSPMKDFGYDVSDYKDVDPIFGNIHDFKTLVAKAKALDLKVMIDMVISHTSDVHPWFLESSKSRSNPKKDWYVWADAKNDQGPNNWLSVFGGSSWEYHEQRRQYYLHNFLKEQPDLNFHCPEVQDAVLDACEFWLKIGVEGFRLDTVNFYFHDFRLRNNPLLKEKPKVLDAFDSNPYILQDHIYDKNQPENLKFLKRLRSLADQYGAILLGEVGANLETNRIIQEYTEGTDKLHLCYGFGYIGGPFQANYFQKEISTFWEEAPSSMICNAFGNHDSTRWASRFDYDRVHEMDFFRLVFTLLGVLKGAMCIYQGEELGLSEYVIQEHELQDPYGKRFYPVFKGRDGCRTPFVWDKTKPNAGFNQGQKTWLPVPKEHIHLSANQQLENKESLLLYVREFLKWRKSLPVLLSGQIQAEVFQDDILRLTRFDAQAGKKLDLYFNFSHRSQNLNLPHKKVLKQQNWKGENQNLGAYGFVIFE